jgi:hypothetical protein
MAIACSNGGDGTDEARPPDDVATSAPTTEVPTATVAAPGTSPPSTTAPRRPTATAPPSPPTTAPTERMAPNDAVTCVFRAFVAGDRDQAVPCATSRATVDELFDSFRPAGVSREDIATWNLMGCATTRSAAIHRCTFQDPTPMSNPVTRFVWLTGAVTDDRHLYTGFEYD